MKYFEWRENSNKGFQIAPTKLLYDIPINGSWAVVPARFIGLSWVDFLFLCVENGAKIYGKDSIYCRAIWDKPNESFLNLINDRATEIIKNIGIKNLIF